MIKISNIYVPIEYSNLKSIIPPEENTIYSTLATASTATSSKYIKKWDTHVLFTNKGIAFMAMNKKKNSNEVEPIYIPLYDLAVTGVLGAPLRAPPYCHLALKRHPDFETKDVFKQRAKAFQAVVAPLVIAAKKQQIEYLESVTGPEEKSSEKKAKKLLKEIPDLEKIQKKWSKFIK
ncbi:MAG: hypothetical protein ACFFA0_06450 [Promethearchaeota archaeon]